MAIQSRAADRIATGYLTDPGWSHYASFLAAMREFHADGHYLNWPIPDSRQGFAELLRYLDEAYTRPIPGYVPEQTHWLVVDEEVCGVLHFRHPLNAALLQFGGHVGYTIRPSRRKRGNGALILELGLSKVWQSEPDLQRILLTCYENNPASRRIIERNGGRWEKTLCLPAHPSPIRHYWIERLRP